MTKTCNDCGETKPKDRFVTDRRRKDGKANRCKDCQRGRVYDWRRDNPKRLREIKATNHKRHASDKIRKARVGRLRREYGITEEEYQQLLKDQKGVCAICGGVPDLGVSLAVDHCHETGRVRGLLCLACNRGLGCLGDTAERLELALDYLKGNKRV